MKILLCGKGGCGKSTLATLMARSCASKGQNVLVVDTDESNYGLHRQLGLDLPEDLTHYFGGKKGAYKRYDETGRVFTDKWSISDIPPEFRSGTDGLHLVAVGKIAEAGEGCACGIGFTAREFLSNLELGVRDTVIIDTEAGVEHFGRGLDKCADIIFMVVDPSYESIRLSEKVSDMGRAFGKPVYLIINRADDDQTQMIRESLRDKDAVIATVPADKSIMEAGLKGEPLQADVPEVEIIVDKLLV